MIFPGRVRKGKMAEGSTHNITWTASDANMADNPITIEYHNGSNWQTIATNEANDGSYSWTVPSLNISNAKVRVTAISLRNSKR